MKDIVTVHFEKRKFDKAFKKYLNANRRATSGLVEHTARKVVTGFSPRSPSAKKVKGLRQFFYDKRATGAKIRQEFKARESAGRGTLRPPGHYVSRKAQSSGIKRSKKAAINWRARRGTAWLQATMLYPSWRPNEEPKTRDLRPEPRKHSGAKPNTSVRISTKGKKPFVVWKSRVPGVTAGKYTNRAIARALRDARLDMMVYVNRKHGKIKF